MIKLKNVWSELKPLYQDKIRKSARKYQAAKRLKYILMAAPGWYDLKLDDIRDILVFTDRFSYDITGADIMYGTEFLNNEK